MVYAKPGSTYSAKCTHAKCNYARNFGAARLQAEIHAGKHARSRPSHHVQVLEVTVLHTFTGLDNMRELPGLGVDEPPF